MCFNRYPKSIEMCSDIFFFLSRLCINVYEFVRQETVLRCISEFGGWTLPRWGRFTNEVTRFDIIEKYDNQKLKPF